jgi:hypothetical protein
MGIQIAFVIMHILYPHINENSFLPQTEYKLFNNDHNISSWFMRVIYSINKALTAYRI